MFARVDAEVLQELRAIVGDRYVLTEPGMVEPYTHDETAGLRAEPEAVLRPATTTEVSRLLRLAEERRIPITPRSGGQGLSGGAVPVRGGIVLSLERMNRILEIDHGNLTATVEPGVITGNLHRAVEKEGLFYPPDPASLDSCCLGGNVACNAGGPRAVKYGVTKDYVCGLQAVLPGGEVLRLGGKLVKDVTGYSLIQLLVGSEGTLAVITEINLRLLPLPPLQIDLLVSFPTFGQAAEAVSAIVGRRIIPTTIEFMEQDSVLASERLLGKEVPGHDAAACLLIQIDGLREDQLLADMDQVGEVCLEHRALDILVARDRPTRDRLWEARRVILDALKHESPVYHMEDVVVPRAQIPALLSGVHERAQRCGVRVVCFGHAGDGNVHVNILKDDMPDEHWREALPELQQRIYQLCLSLGGALTGEHGVGATRRRFLPLAQSQAQIELQRRLKLAFDPHQILNPGKVLPEPSGSES